MARGVRRTRKENIIKEIFDIEAKETLLNEKLAALEEQRLVLQNELAEVEAEEARVAEENKAKEILAMIRKKGLTLDQVKGMLENNH